MVEYTANYLADHWCVKGHILLCIEGELQTELQDGRVYTLRPGMSYQVSDHGEPHRGRKLGRWMMEAITSHPDLQGLRRFVLVTRDAHGLYGKFGFRALARHEGYMELHRPDIYTA